MVTEKVSKNIENFYCENCDYNTCYKSSYKKHIQTLKHIKTLLGDEKNEETKKIECDKCKKTYHSRNGLWKHQKICQENMDIIEPKKTEITPELIMSVMQQNKELQTLVIEQNKTITELAKTGQIMNMNTNNINNVNSNNKTFNLNFFLNETCKNAMNITDFVNSIQLQLSDLENVGKDGFINGISNIIVKNLKSLDITQRPVHCTDSKREVLYIKDENKWEKEGEENNKLRKAIKHVAYKNTKMLSAFREKHPDCNKSESKYSDQYNKLIIEAMGGKGDNDKEKEDKIIKNIAKEVIIEK